MTHKDPNWLGIGKTQYANQGLPICIIGNKPAWTTEKIVIASADLLIAILHFCLKINKTAEIINTVKNLPKEYSGKVINVNFPDLSEEECKGIKITALAQRGVPSKPVEVFSEKNTKRYRYNLSGEPIQEEHLTDAEAVKDGFISISVLDYGLDRVELRESLKEHINE